MSFTVSTDGGATTSENPTLTLTRNATYVFDVQTAGNPFALHTLPGNTAVGARFLAGVSNSGTTAGQLVFSVGVDAPNQLWYQSETQFAIFGRIDIVPTLSQPDAPPTLPPTTAPATTPIWKPTCNAFVAAKDAATTVAGPTTNFEIITTSGFGKRDTAAPANPEVIFGSPPTDPPITKPKTSGSGATEAAGPASGSGRSYKCLTTTRAEQLMDFSLFYYALEGTSPSEVCTKPTDGPGIFAPAHCGRYFMAVSVAMFNGWAVYDRYAVPVASNNPPPRRASVRQRTQANKEISMTYSLFEVMSFILPNRRAVFAQALFEAYGLDMESPDTQAGIDGRDAGLDFIASHLAIDKSNQENCYADTTGWKRSEDGPVLLDSYETVAASLASRRKIRNWADVKWTGFVVNRKFLTPHASKWKRIVYTPEESEALLPTVNPLPSDEQLDREMQFLTDVQRDLTSDNGKKKLDAHFWADGPRTTLPPGHLMEVMGYAVARPKLYSLDQATRMYLLGGVAVFESGVQAWILKRKYETVRPGEYIPLTRLNATLKGQFRRPYCPHGDIQGWQWRPYQLMFLNTPPFPEWPSGHSSFSSSVMATMAMYTGSDTVPKVIRYPFKRGNLGYKFGAESHCFRNGTTFDGSRCTFAACALDANFTSENQFSPISDGEIGPFYTFSEIALSAGYSRLYGGIHPMSGNLAGLSMGSQTGARTYRYLCEKHIGWDGCLAGKEDAAAFLAPAVGAIMLILFLTVLL